MYNAVQIYNNIETMLIVRGISIRKAEIEAGLARGSLNNIKNGSMPSVDKVAALADYLGCSIDYLVGREKIIAPVETDKSELAAVLKELSKRDIEKLIDFAKFIQAGK